MYRLATLIGNCMWQGHWPFSPKICEFVTWLQVFNIHKLAKVRWHRWR